MMHPGLFDDVLGADFDEEPQETEFDEVPAEEAVTENLAPKPEEPAAKGKSYDRAEYHAKKKAERDTVYAIADKAASLVSTDLNALSQYLEVQARFPRTTATNALLIMQQEPKATKLHTFDEWAEKGMKIRKGAAAVAIIVPGDEYRKADGSVGMSYKVAKVFADTQLSSALPEPPKPTYDEWIANADAVTFALARSVPVEWVRVAECPSYVRYNSRTRKIEYVAQFPNRTTLMQRGTFAWAQADYELRTTPQDFSEATSQFNAACLSYMLCSHYGFAPVPVCSVEPLANLSPLDQRRQLETIRRDFQRMVDEIDKRVKQQEKEKRNKGGVAR